MNEPMEKPEPDEKEYRAWQEQQAANGNTLNPVVMKPCPFCGEKAKIGSLEGDKENWAIWCECGRACVETGLNGDTKEKIIEAWNSRKDPK